jgi:hypothetical protein
MSTRRFFRELVVFIGVVGGAVIGYCAGQTFEPSVQTAFAFLGMSLGGVFTDICIQGGNR